MTKVQARVRLIIVGEVPRTGIRKLWGRDAIRFDAYLDQSLQIPDTVLEQGAQTRCPLRPRPLLYLGYDLALNWSQAEWVSGVWQFNCSHHYVKGRPQTASETRDAMQSEIRDFKAQGWRLVSLVEQTASSQWGFDCLEGPW